MTLAVKKRNDDEKDVPDAAASTHIILMARCTHRSDADGE
jgi:hypothetical protein